MSFAPEDVQNYPIDLASLPQGWKVTTIAEIAMAVEPGFPSGRHNQEGRGIPHLRPMNISRDGIVDLSEVKYVEGSPKAWLIDGDVLFNNTNSPELIGKTALIRNPSNWAFSNHMTRIHPAPGISSAYLAHQLHYLWMSGYFRYRCVHHVNQASISSGPLANTVPVVIAPTAEQERIVAAIEEQFSRLDAGVAVLERVRENLKRMQFAVLLAAVQGVLVPQCADDEPAANMIAKVKTTTRFRGTQEPLDASLGPLPPGWAWARVGKLADRVTVGHVGPTKGKYVPQGIPFLRSQNVRPDSFDPTGLVWISPGFHKSLAKSIISPGDVVIVRSGVNRGMACAVPEPLGEANCADLVIVQKPSGIHPRFLCFFINSLARQYVQSQQVGVAIPHFNTQSLSALPVPVPPLNEQFRIVEEADRILSFTKRLTEIISGQIVRSKTLRSSVLMAAFSGRLALQDPSDEPASTLLERVDALRASSNGRSPRKSRQAPSVAGVSQA